jgi:ABC-type Fe3+ transport system permease subunit
MPFRAVLYTLVCLALAFLAVGMWVRAISPMVAEVYASTQPSATHPGISATRPASTQADRPDKQFKGILRATLILSFIAICLVLVIGLFATLREWFRMTLKEDPKRRRTRYIDAWKLAGERAQPLETDDDGEKTE